MVNAIFSAEGDLVGAVLPATRWDGGPVGSEPAGLVLICCLARCSAHLPLIAVLSSWRWVSARVRRRGSGWAALPTERWGGGPFTVRSCWSSLKKPFCNVGCPSAAFSSTSMRAHISAALAAAGDLVGRHCQQRAGVAVQSGLKNVSLALMSPLANLAAKYFCYQYACEGAPSALRRAALPAAR